MTDRTPTQVLENGAIRYAVYDENSNLLRYEYMLPADEPTNFGTPLNKSTLLSDYTENYIYGNTGNRTVDTVLRNLHLSIRKKAGYAITHYIGTGTYGNMAPCQIDVRPLIGDANLSLALITPDIDGDSIAILLNLGYGLNPVFTNLSETGNISYVNGIKTTFNDGILSFWSRSGPVTQMNTANETYLCKIFYKPNMTI